MPTILSMSRPNRGTFILAIPTVLLMISVAAAERPATQTIRAATNPTTHPAHRHAHPATRPATQPTSAPATQASHSPIPGRWTLTNAPANAPGSLQLVFHAGGVLDIIGQHHNGRTDFENGFWQQTGDTFFNFSVGSQLIPATLVDQSTFTISDHGIAMQFQRIGDE
jgi:hypothetical protein